MQGKERSWKVVDDLSVALSDVTMEAMQVKAWLSEAQAELEGANAEDTGAGSRPRSPRLRGATRSACSSTACARLRRRSIGRARRTPSWRRGIGGAGAMQQQRVAQLEEELRTVRRRMLVNPEEVVQVLGKFQRRKPIAGGSIDVKPKIDEDSRIGA
ncbi:hypothetical protein BAE44_0008595 [Dichanthelium oligosanthes]|uniref:Uncharacterized protein n=1 Tax=Dichanthelium oligosanthes TaxID=888268 RepID=A0A1E5VZ49_9POAL|nr:hypothetical protein BAE44_0008595 [Dichanthelium oligosanthes]